MSFFRRRGRRAYGDHIERRQFKPISWPAVQCDADEDHCPVCDATYAAFRGSHSRESAESMLRGWDDKWGEFEEKEAPAGDVMQMMRQLKMQEWVERHGWCHFRDEPEDPHTLFAQHEYVPPKKQRDLICFETPKGKKTQACLIGTRRKNTGHNRPPKGGADCRDKKGRFSSCSTSRKTTPVKKRR